jgi:hypothetical protein
MDKLKLMREPKLTNLRRDFSKPADKQNDVSTLNNIKR